MRTAHAKSSFFELEVFKIRHSRIEERNVWNLCVDFTFSYTKRFPITLVPRCRE